MTGWRQTLGAVLFAALLAGPALSQNSGLTRLTDRDDLFGWEAVGRLELGVSGYCTGVLIAPHLVLTAAHCVFDRQGDRIAPDTMRFRAGLRDGKTIAERRVTRHVAPGAYDPLAGMSAENLRNDAALLELDTPIQAALADPFVLHGAPRAGLRLSVVSYGRDRDSAPSWQRDCGLEAFGGGLMQFDCDVTFGASGAPVFTRDGHRARILSLVSGGSRDAGAPVAYGMELPALVDTLKRDLRAATPAQPVNGGFRRVQVDEGHRASGARFARP
ncbi:MAG: trypsin-like serine peptidase [Pseudomonadota bacterium]|uniref:trypsin-like serine peptidase n=1 Tax=Roseovarius TaxID=74030 RepID=UPI0022A8302A|nr:trypsin-like peptidase domain-containing protein [Roseovarius sp. EGI FJ00037]MCZ0813811.1 trypsin-like peptidase domain-containing protein [Roseovarius sp. EGI FJ00037]